MIVADDRRGDGVGAALLDALTDHNRLHDVHLVLLCREGLVPFYESGGFERYPESVAVPDDHVHREQPLVQPICPAGRD